MSEEKEEGEAAEGGAKKGGKKKLVLILVLVLVLVGGGVGGFLVLGKKAPEKEGETEEVAHEEATHTEVAELAPFIVNLSESSSFLKVTMKLEYDPSLLEVKGEHGEKGGSAGGGHGSGGGGEAAGGGGLPHKLQEREHAIRDAIITVLSSKKSDDVLSADGKDNLKEELLDAINRAIGLDESPVVGIYFTEFIVQ